MTSIGVLQIAVVLRADPRLHEAAGCVHGAVFEGQRTFLHPVLRWLEVLTYKVIGVKEDVEQRWTHYTASLLSFSIFGFLLTYLLQRAAGCSAVQPAGLRRRQCHARFWRSTRPPASSPTRTGSRIPAKSTLSYFVQMAALAVQNFASAAAGIAIAIALVRGFRAAGEEDHRQLLGGRHPRDRLRAAADLD